MYIVKKQITNGMLAGFTFVDQVDVPMVPGRMYQSDAPQGCRYIVLACRRAS